MRKSWRIVSCSGFISRIDLCNTQTLQSSGHSIYATHIYERNYELTINACSSSLKWNVRNDWMRQPQVRLDVVKERVWQKTFVKIIIIIINANDHRSGREWNARPLLPGLAAYVGYFSQFAIQWWIPKNMNAQAANWWEKNKCAIQQSPSTIGHKLIIKIKKINGERLAMATKREAKIKLWNKYCTWLCIVVWTRNPQLAWMPRRINALPSRQPGAAHEMKETITIIIVIISFRAR